MAIDVRGPRPSAGYAGSSQREIVIEAIDAVFEHCSIAKTASLRFGLDALTARAALAPDMTREKILQTV